MAAMGGVRDEPVEGCGDIVSAEKRRKRAERTGDIIANPSSPYWASYFTGPPLGM
jgi:hypothetical protein